LVGKFQSSTQDVSAYIFIILIRGVDAFTYDQEWHFVNGAWIENVLQSDFVPCPCVGNLAAVSGPEIPCLSNTRRS
jgi:hypothetical protein